MSRFRSTFRQLIETLRSWSAGERCAIALFAAAALCCASGADDNASDAVSVANSPRERLAAMTAGQLAELQRKQERFDELASDEQERMRDLHRRLESHPKSDSLKSIMVRYANWLRELPAGQRAELLSMTKAERLNKIREILKRQEQERFQRLAADQLDRDDYPILIEWIQQLAVARKDRLLEKMPESIRDRIQSLPQKDLDRILVFNLMRSSENLDVQPEEFAKLAEQVSDSAKKTLNRASDQEQRIVVIREWVKVAFMSRTRFSSSREPVPEATLLEFYKKLDEKTRERLNNMSAGDMKRELESMYRNRSWMRRSPWRGRSGPRPEGPGKGQTFGGGRHGEKGEGRGREGDRRRGDGPTKDDAPPPPPSTGN